MNPLRIVFMGTPEFAVPSLAILLENQYDIRAVVTVPDKQAGRGLQMLPSPIKRFALFKGLAVLQPEKLKDPSFIRALHSLNPDLFVVVAFRMLPETVWRIPSKGTFNLHASLLPDYRGAAPINHAIINGETKTGVTTFFIDKEIDTGHIILQQETDIKPNETAGELHDRLMGLGASLVLKTVQQIAAGTVRTRSQSEKDPRFPVIHQAPKLFREQGQIDWNRPGTEIVNLVHGLSPSPGAYTYILIGKEKKLLKIYQAEFTPGKPKQPTSTLITDGKNELSVTVNDGIVRLLSLQAAGRKRLNTPEFLRGYSQIKEAEIAR